MPWRRRSRERRCRRRIAVGLAALLNFVGAFLSLKVAATIAEDIVKPDAVTPAVILAGLLGGYLLESHHLVARHPVVVLARR